MSNVYQNLKAAAPELQDAALASIMIDPIVIESGAIRQVAPYLLDRGFRRVLIAADVNTHAAAGIQLWPRIADAGISVQTTLIKPDSQGDVIADEASLVQLMLDIRQTRAEAVIAVGSGTIHDIARYSAYTTGIPFISVPTAPSVDGFNSKGAPLIIRGEKRTFAAIAPEAIFADLDVLCAAPGAMVAAGFGDMLGKYTALFDWTYGAAAANEPYADAVAAITKQALHKCVEHAEAIGRRDQEGIRVLTEALIESGLAMLLFGQSHPASGAEHHLSHYWEMEYLRLGRRALLHGAKVGVACAIIADQYRRIAGEQAELLAADRNRLEQAIAEIPPAEELQRLLQTAGAPSTPEELGIDRGLLARSLREAHRVRANRHTLLRAFNEATASAG
ncbi:sn-glycerol-1-phosphate dehydrogenase [Paenibacillus xylaniclasticus]|uniref:sn-glycerol-1-phosphate dehydrogenase n=1 Tax=Paenibacillus xylaniclasticus TaxID=588083 RepID=UPI000FDB8B0E|nr:MULTISPECIES: sn-glycerol-1-phosphate dehydrogenase [Paenibacillus]GFN30190.1 glycerol-1-phosphate dehydrogenase [NAD(P)+] [Paenibacillus curdlanolyticus]